MDTQLEQRGNAVAFVILGGLVLWAISRRSTGGEPGAPVSGPVQLGGSVQQVQVGQRSALMGTHLVQKRPGESILVLVNWAGLTQDASGRYKPWTYKLLVRIGHNTILGWRTATQLGFPGASEYVTVTPSVTGAQSASYSFSAVDDVNQEWDVRVTLWAKKADAMGNPVPGTTDDDWIEVATGEHVRAVLTLGGVIALAGAVGTVTVNQQRGRLAGLRKR